MKQTYKILHYKVDYNWCKTKCPHYPAVGIGSLTCQDCYRNKKTTEKYVECLFKEKGK